MAKMRVEDMYWRIYADHKLKIYTLTMVPLSEPSHHELVAHVETLRAIARGLRMQGWRSCQRRAFEILIRQETAQS